MEQTIQTSSNLLEEFMNVLTAYFTYGPRSSKRTDILNAIIAKMVENVICSKYGNMGEYSIRKEYAVKSTTKSGQKKCDLVVLKNNEPFIIFPIKNCMTNYSQNCYNYWENLTGEVSHLKWANPNVHIVPVNILMSKLPYLKNDNTIKHWENITYENSFKIYENLVQHNLVKNNYNVILEVAHVCEVGQKFDKVPQITNVLENCSLNTILEDII
jgi:hypothetical protein